MSLPIARSVANMRNATRGLASSARIFADAAPSAAAPAAASRPPRSNNKQSQRASQSGGKASDRLRSGQRNRDGSRPPRNTPDGGNRNGNDRRNKRLPSVFDASSGSRPARTTSIKSQEIRKIPAPVPTTDWNSPLFSKPGFERLLAPAPRASSIFVPDLTAAAPSTPSSGGKGKGKAAAPAAKVANAKLNLPGIKTAVSALKLHIRPGGRNILGPLNNPTGVASGSLSLNRLSLPKSSKGGDDRSLAADVKAARIALQNEQIGGSYERFGTESVLKSSGVQAQAKGVTNQAVKDAAQALAVNADLAPEGKSFVAKTIAERLGA